MHSPPVTGILDIGSHTMEKSVVAPNLNITEQRQKAMMPTIFLFILCDNAAVFHLSQLVSDTLTKKLFLMEHFTCASHFEQPIENTVTD